MSRYAVHPVGDGSVRLPAGAAAIVLDLCRPWGLGGRGERMAVISVDRQDVARGPFDHRVVVVPAGPHLLRARDLGSVDAVEVDLPAGAVLTVEYAAAANKNAARLGRFGPPGTRPPGFPTEALILGLLSGLAAGLVVMFAVGALWPPARFVALLLVAAAVLYRVLSRPRRPWRRRQRPDPPQVLTAASSPAVPVPLATAARTPERGAGLLVSWEYEERPGPVRAAALGPLADDPPVATIDGRPVTADWAARWYPLPPGRHTVEVTAPVPASLDVEIAAGVAVTARYRARLATRKPGPVPVDRDRFEDHPVLDGSSARLTQP